MVVSVELILGIIGTVSGIIGANYTVSQLTRNRPRLFINDIQARHYVGEGPYSNSTFIVLSCKIRNKGHIGTRVTKAVIEIYADERHTFTHNRLDNRVEPSDTASFRDTFSIDGKRITASKIQGRGTFYHTYNTKNFQFESEFVSDLSKLGI